MRIVHGAGAIARVGELVAELGVTRPMLVTDKGVVAAGLADATLAHLEDAVLFDDVRPNPDVALVDPELMLGLPPAITAATGMDALSHAIECYTCDYHQPFNDAVALLAIELVGRWLRVAYDEGSNLEARTNMAHAATLGGLAYGTESAGAAHAMSQSAGGVHECPHGALTARVLGPVCEYNAPAAPERYARVAQGLDVDLHGVSTLDAGLLGVEEVYRLTDDVGIPTMTELGFFEEENPMLARIAS